MGSGRLLIIIPFILAAVLALVLSAAAWRRVRSPGSLSFALACLSVAVWLLASAMQVSTNVEAEIITWAKVAYLGMIWLPPFWLLFVMEYIYPAGRYVNRYAPLLLVIPIITLALVMTNDAHHLFWSQIRLVQAGAQQYLVFDRGPWYWVFTGYAATLLAASAVMLVRAVAQFPPARRPQVIGLLITLVLPWGANILFNIGSILGPGYDNYTNFGFAISALILSWILFRRGLFQHTPLAYEAIIENISDGFLLFDQHERLLEINTAARGLLHMPGDAQLVGKPASSLLAECPELLQLLRSGKFRQIEISASGPNKTRDLEASVSAWIDLDRKAGKLIILHDITRRRRVEADLRASERLYRQLIEAAPVGILMVDSAGIVTFASPRIYQQYGLASEDGLIGRPLLDLIHPDFHPVAEERLRDLSSTRAVAAPQLYRLIRPDGSTFWGETVSAPVITEDHGETGTLTITLDVTSRKTLESQLKHNLERQTFINNLLHTLYRAHNLKSALAQTLAEVGQYFQASRVYLCQDSPDGAETSILSEWRLPHLRPRAEDIPLVRYAEIPGWRQRMEEQSSLVIANTREPEPDGVTQALSEFLQAWNVVSCAAFPIFGIEERLYGFLAVDHCEQPRAWDEDGQGLMMVVSRILSGAVGRLQLEQAEQRQRALAESLHDSAAALNSTLNLEEVLDRILSNLERVVPRVSASIALMDEAGVIRFVRWRGYNPAGDDFMRSVRLRLNDRRTYRLMAQTGDPILIPDTWVDERWVSYEPYTWIRSFAGAPIRLKGKVVGFINLDSPETNFFPDDLAYSLRVFADQAAVAIENARLYDAARGRAEEMSILYRIGLTLTSGLETEQVLISLFDECRQVLPIDVFYVAYYDEVTGSIEMPFYYNDQTTQIIPSRNIQTSPSLTGEVIRQRRTIYIPDTTDTLVEQAFGVLRLGGQPTRSYVGVPLIVLDRVVGVISMQSYIPNAYKPEQIRLLETIATQAAITVQNTRLYEQMRQMAITDSVTGLNTRRHFTTLARGEIERALRYNRKCGVLMVDLDHFKQVNDTYGHNAGDQVLQTVAVVCRQALRATDIVGRWGGEEFVIMLPEADRDGAKLIAERIRRMMAERDIVVGQDTIRVMVSIGVATLDEHCCTLEHLIDCADRALYMAKQAGRNRVVCL